MKLIFGIFFIISVISFIGLATGIYLAFSFSRHRIVPSFMVLITIIAMAGFALGLYSIYKAHKQSNTIIELSHQLRSKQQVIDNINLAQSKQLLFIHHSVGAGWLDQGQLAESLLANGIGVHDATYGDMIGEDTDMNHWVPKFDKHMDKIFAFNYHPDTYYKDDRQNDIIMFKSCFPNSDIQGEGAAPGNPTDPTKTVWNYKAVFEKLTSDFAKYPDKIFIYITAPPLVPNVTTPENAARAREFNNWVKADFVKQYTEKTGLNNFLVFDFFDVLADNQGMLKEEYRPSQNDSHPNSRGTQAATASYMQFLRDNGVITNN